LGYGGSAMGAGMEVVVGRLKIESQELSQKKGQSSNESSLAIKTQVNDSFLMDMAKMFHMQWN
jgi:hypothetical protein